MARNLVCTLMASPRPFESLDLARQAWSMDICELQSDGGYGMRRPLTRPAIPNEQHCATPMLTIPLSRPQFVVCNARPALITCSYAGTVGGHVGGVVHFPHRGLCPPGSS